VHTRSGGVAFGGLSLSLFYLAGAALPTVLVSASRMGPIERRAPMRFSKIPGEDFSQIAFSPKIGKLHRVIIERLHRVTICRELMHSDQINKSEHGETDRVAFWQCLGAKGSGFLRETTPRLSSMGEGNFWSM
jgi:hypothetical protein